MRARVSFSAYDSDALRLLSGALADAFVTVRTSAAHPLTEIETANLTKRIADNLMSFYDRGERDPSALKRAALEGIAVLPGKP